MEPEHKQKQNMTDRFNTAIDRADEWAKPRLRDIIRLLPFNPVIAKKAFEELLIPEKAGNWKEISNLFATDPGLMSKFYDESRRYLQVKQKLNRPLRNIEDAVAVLGIESVVSVLEKAMSDEIIEKMSKVPYVEMQLIWKESWGIGYAAELLAPNWKLDVSKALHIGLLADLGMLILAQLYKIEYFLKADAMFQNNVDNIYETEDNLRLTLEKKHFGINHAELGAWLLSYFGLTSDYSKAVLFHEEQDLSPEWDGYSRLINVSRRISRLTLMQDKFKKFYDGMNTLDIENNFAVINLRTKYTIYGLLDDHAGLVQKEADNVISDVIFRINKHSENLSGNISLLQEKDFLEALDSISANRDKAIMRLASLLEAEIGSKLPQPTAVLYKKLSNPRAKVLEYPTMVTELLSTFIRILSSISLSLLFFHCGQEEKKFTFQLKKLIPQNKNGKLFLDMGSGTEMALRIASYLSREKKDALVSADLQMIEFILLHANNLFDICRMRRDLKTGRGADIEKLIQKLFTVLKAFAGLNAEIYAVTNLEYISSDKKNPFRVELINWMNIMPLEMRDPVQIKRQQPMASGEQGAFLYTKKAKQFQLLPDFLIYKRCGHCKKKHFYITDYLKLPDSDKTKTITIRLAPVSKDYACPPVQWPAYKKLL